MAVTVYSRLGELLLNRNLTVADLDRQIGERFGLDVDRRALQRLSYTEPVERVDMGLVGAAAAILGVGLGELFEVEAVEASLDDGGSEIGDLAPDQSRRLSELLDHRARQGLSPAEQSELETLVDEYGRRLHDRLVYQRASGRGRSAEAARAEAAAELQRAIAWWRAVENDAEWRRGALPPRRRRGQDE